MVLEGSIASNTLVIMIDFFANLELQGQDGVNSQHAAQASQDLAVVSYTSNIVDGPPALSRVNHHWSF
jgi:hypothetical protein